VRTWRRDSATRAAAPAIGMLKPARLCGKQQATGRVTLRTCLEDGAVVRMQGRASSWMTQGCQSFYPFSPSDWQTVSLAVAVQSLRTSGLANLRSDESIPLHQKLPHIRHLTTRFNNILQSLRATIHELIYPILGHPGPCLLHHSIHSLRIPMGS
jgi:hypothetical protein